MRVRKYGSKILRKVAKKVDDSFPVKDYADEMFYVLHKKGGVGLALPQIGESKRMFIIDVEGVKRTFVNPDIEFIGNKVLMNEGCLSIPGIEEGLLRYERVKVNYTDDRWRKKTEEFSGLVARVIQHEYDHLDGILYIDYLSEEKLKELSPDLTKISTANKDNGMDAPGMRFNTAGSTRQSGIYGSSHGFNQTINVGSSTRGIVVENLEDPTLSVDGINADGVNVTAGNAYTGYTTFDTFTTELEQGEVDRILRNTDATFNDVNEGQNEADQNDVDEGL
jgi:peptide deformylase